MKGIYLLYGTRKNENIEVLIVETREKTSLENAKNWAVRNEFKNIREVFYSDNVFEKPNFKQTINL
jgi:hypothetical protein